MRCPTCGSEVPKGARYCPGCGAALVSAHPRMSTGLLPSLHLLNNRYSISRKIAQGGQSAVYLAYDTYQHDSERAIKEMSQSQVAPEKRTQAINDFIREARMLQELEHPSLARVTELFLEDNKYYLVMEFVPGHNLEDELVQYRREALDWEDVTAWGMALADTLTYLHSRTPPIIYRDLKPANVMLLPDGSVKLIDFGIARVLHNLRPNDTMQLGTDGYAPLEQYSSRSEPRSDIYALGASMYHLLTGRVPDAAPLRMAGHNLTPIRVINPRTPEVVERVIMKALSLQAQDRFRTAQELREALEWARKQSQSRAAGLGADRARLTGAPAPSAAPSAAQGVRPTGAPVGPRSGGYLPSSSSSSAAHGPGYPAGPPTVRRLNDQPLPPRLYVWPVRVDAGYVLVNQTTSLMLDIANRGGGTLAGRAETNIAALSVEPPRFDRPLKALKVRIDAHGLAVGPYVCHIALRTNGGDQIVQVRFVVRPAGEPLDNRNRIASGS